MLNASRFGGWAALGASAALLLGAAGPALATTEEPVAYAFTGAYHVPAFDAEHERFAEVFGSPAQRGVNGVVPPSAESAEDFLPVGPMSTGTAWFIHVNADAGVFGDTPPSGATADAHFESSAAMRGDGTPSATVSADYLLEAQNALGDSAEDHRWLYLDDVRSEAECRSPQRVSASTAASGMWVRQPDRGLAAVPVPAAGESYEVRDVPLRLPRTTMEHQNLPQFADITVRRVTDAADLVPTDQWRTGDVNATSGWRVEVASYVLVDGVRTDLDTSVIILGGTTCSVPAS